MTSEKFMDGVYAKTEKDYGLCPPPTTDKEALDILRDHFLGENWYVTMPVSHEQANTEMVAAILDDNPKRRDFRQWLKDKL